MIHLAAAAVTVAELVPDEAYEPVEVAVYTIGPVTVCPETVKPALPARS